MANMTNKGSAVVFLLGVGVLALTLPFALAKRTAPSPECVEGEVVTGSRDASCGLNGRGTVPQERTGECVDGSWQYTEWEDVGACTDTDECVDGTTETLRNPDGTVVITRTCVNGHWEST